jgi:hypothetical protein
MGGVENHPAEHEATHGVTLYAAAQTWKDKLQSIFARA